MATIPLNKADKTLLDRLRDGRNVPANLATDTGYHRQYIYERLKRLAEHGVVRNVGNGVYEIIDEPPAEARREIPESIRDVEPVSATEAVKLIQSEAAEDPITEDEMLDLIHESRHDWESKAVRDED